MRSHDENRDIYRVSIDPEDGAVHITRVGLSLIGHFPEVREGLYMGEQIPQWVQERIAVLSILKPDERPSATIPDVGRRIGKNTFWVFAPDVC